MPRNISDRDLARFRNTHLGESIPVPPKPKRRNNEESREQQGLINWWRVACVQHGLLEMLLFAIPNGGRRDAITGAIMKREGVRSGAPDLMLAVPRGGYNGLFVELKVESGVVMADQKEFINALRVQGYYATAAFGFDDAKRVIEAYLRGDQFLTD